MASFVDEEPAGEDHTETCLAFPPSAFAPPLARYTEGSVLSGKYRLDSLLGEGGMGAVWRAANLLLDLPVAIKLIRADLDRNSLRARLQLEARSVAKLGHPAIVRIYDVGETEAGDPFIVMELLHGETLAQMLAQGRLSAVHTVQLLLPIIDACAVAHARGIVHRDLKPDNLLIARENQRIQPKILDFGIAKLTDPRDANHRLTEAGTVVGSPDYMSPEQARGRDDVDYRTDIWSLCVVLYEAITGAVPFTAANYNALLRAIVEDQPSPLVDHAAGDAELWAILRKGLSKDPQDRHRSMAELGRALATWLLNCGVQEDVCGTALDSKWLGRSSDPLSLGEAAPVGPTLVSPKFDPKRTHDSRPAGNGIDSRGPFTATIRPKSTGRRRALRAAGVASALLGALALAFVVAPDQHLAGSAVQGVAAARSEAAPATTPRVAINAAPPARDDATVVMPATENAVVGASSTDRASVAVSPAKSAPLARPVLRSMSAATVGRQSVAPASQHAAPPPPKPSSRELDLISPY